MFRRWVVAWQLALSTYGDPLINRTVHRKAVENESSRPQTLLNQYLKIQYPYHPYQCRPYQTITPYRPHLYRSYRTKIPNPSLPQNQVNLSPATLSPGKVTAMEKTKNCHKRRKRQRRMRKNSVRKKETRRIRKMSKTTRKNRHLTNYQTLLHKNLQKKLMLKPNRKLGWNLRKPSATKIAITMLPHSLWTRWKPASGALAFPGMVIAFSMHCYGLTLVSTHEPCYRCYV